MKFTQKQRYHRTSEQWLQPWPVPRPETLDADTEKIDELLTEIDA